LIMKTNTAKQFTTIHRGLHWCTAALMSVLFITGFLRMNWMGKQAILNAIERHASGAISQAQTQGIIKSILWPMWQWHELAAYILFAVIAARLIYMAVAGIRFPNPFQRQQALKERIQGLVYILFYLLVVITAITGSYLKWGDGSLKAPMEAVHKWAIYWFPIFAILHFIGIWMTESTLQKGITSRMIGGDE